MKSASHNLQRLLVSERSQSRRQPSSQSVNQAVRAELKQRRTKVSRGSPRRLQSSKYQLAKSRLKKVSLRNLSVQARARSLTWEPQILSSISCRRLESRICRKPQASSCSRQTSSTRNSVAFTKHKRWLSHSLTRH